MLQCHHFIAYNHPSRRVRLLRLGLPTELTSLWANISHIKPTQITADTRNIPWCYACIPGASTKISHLCIEVLSWKQGKLETWNPGLLCKESEGFWRLLMPNTDLIQFLFTEYTEFWFSSCFVQSWSCVSTYNCMSSFSMWNCNLLKATPE
jgi:hypothetical protein